MVLAARRRFGDCARNSCAASLEAGHQHLPAVLPAQSVGEFPVAPFDLALAAGIRGAAEHRDPDPADDLHLPADHHTAAAALAPGEAAQQTAVAGPVAGSLVIKSLIWLTLQPSSGMVEGMNKSSLTITALTILRVIAGFLFAAHGWQKFNEFTIAGTQAAFSKMGVPAAEAVAPVIATLELVGGIA